MRPHISSDEAHRIAFDFSLPDDPYFATHLRMGWANEGTVRPHIAIDHLPNTPIAALPEQRDGALCNTRLRAPRSRGIRSML
jgi:hypothetical protein